MTRILMCGPFSLSGGVSNHTKNLIKHLSLLGADIIFFNFHNKNPSSSKSSPITKTYRRTIGLLLEIILHKNEYDLIHIQTSGGITSFISSITGSLASKVVNKKLIVTFHHSNTEEFVDKYKFVFGFVLGHLEKMVLVSKKQKDFISIKFPKYLDKLIVIPNGYDSSLFYPMDVQECRNRLNLPKDKKIIYNISNLIEVKGHKYLIKAMGNIVNYRNDVLCVIVGRGELKNDLESQIEKLGLEDYVKLLGWKPEEDVPIFMNACDFFVHSSLKEGNPTVMFESLGCGKAYVGTSVGGVPEIINSEKFGLLCEPENPDKLAELILIGLDTHWDSEDIMEYSEIFSWSNISKKTLKCYDEVFN